MPVYEGKKVAVIGGGGGAVAAAREVLRRGAALVMCVYGGLWDMDDADLLAAEAEGAVFLNLVDVVAVENGGGEGCGEVKIKLQRMRPGAVPIPDYYEDLAVDVVINA